VRKIRVAVHQASLANRSAFTCCSFPPFKKPSPWAKTSCALVGSVCVYVCVCVSVCVSVKDCLCMDIMFCHTHAEGQQGFNGANPGSL